MTRLRGMTVLLVEDDIDNLELLSACLEAEGALTLSAGSIAAALAITIGHQLNVVVSDLELADGDGCALLQQLGNRENGKRAPAIAVTGYSQEHWRNKAASCGFTRYAVKPFPLERLVDWIAELGSSVKSSSRAEETP